MNTYAFGSPFQLSQLEEDSPQPQVLRPNYHYFVLSVKCPLHLGLHLEQGL